MAEGVGFEPTLGLLLSLISSQVPSTTQPPFLRLQVKDLQKFQPDQILTIGQVFRTFASPGQADSAFPNADFENKSRIKLIWQPLSNTHK